MHRHPRTHLYRVCALFRRLDQRSGSGRLRWLAAVCATSVAVCGQAQADTDRLATETAEQDFAGSFSVPSAAESYNVARGILLAADVRDPSPQGTRAKKAAADEEVKINLQEITVRAKRYTKVGPNSGLALTREEIPGNVQSLTAEDIKRSNSISIADLMNTQLQSVMVNDYQGNPFQMDVQYRGFTASPQLGTSQGLSVFLDGIRVNEPFGDVVNWDMIPMNALASLDVIPGSNPLYGLGTLGGALSMRTKNGFDNPGVEMKTLTGSFGRKQFLMSAGANNGVVGGFMALNLFDEDGWRDNSPSKVNQGFVKLDYRVEKFQLNFSSLFTGNDLVGNGLLPTEMYKKDPSQVFSSPDETKNRLQQFQLSGEYFVNDEFSITGQVYRRRSQRQGFNGDINEDFNVPASRSPNPGEKVACGFADNNADGLPDYSVGTLGTPPGARVRNAPLPPGFERMVRQGFSTGQDISGGGPAPGSPSSSRYAFSGQDLIGGFDETNPIEGGYYYDDSGVQQFIYFDPVVNNDPNDPNACVERDASGTVRTKLRKINRGIAGVSPFILPIYDANGRAIQRDGAGQAPDGKGAGYIPGTPNALITKTAVAQVTDGANMQLNWNLEKHKFMVGASVDSANSSYEAQQFLSVLDASRNVSLNPAAVAPEFYAASNGIGLNDFAGTSITKSLYASETWSPVETLHITAAARYNYTRVRNVLEVRALSGDRGPGSFLGGYETAVICPSSDPASCPDAQISYAEVLEQLRNFARDSETEMFKYRSFNPALGAAWQTTPELNIYANWNKGARTPSVIELGCALDDTPVNLNRDNPNEPPVFVPRSIAQNRFCSLPSTLAGDPYLEQVRSETKEFGLRGQWGPNITWNATAYRTDLRDDIYFVSFRPERSFFQNIGDTRRQGIEMGLTGKYGKLDFRLNYSITDASFQDGFDLASPHNSQADPNEFYYGEDPFNPGQFRYLENPKYGTIRVKKGNRMPGIPLQNMNANISYQVTPKWRVGLTMVAHSGSYVRGNENNAHRPGPATSGIRFSYDPNTGSNEYFSVDRPDWLNEGSLPGYATFNFSTSYDLGKGWAISAVVNNLFDKEYFSAGRLALNPFSPSINGAIGVSGFNYNTNEWRSTNSIAPAAPRAIWFALSYEFDPNRK
jgi:outer membrane receptor protein involved in Fe transport